jgi:hypothetical protein
MITGRAMLGAAGAALLATRQGEAQQQLRGFVMQNMGGAPAGFPVRPRATRGGVKPFDFVEHCHTLGVGVVASA